MHPSCREKWQGKAVFQTAKVARLSEPRNRQVSAGTAELLCWLLDNLVFLELGR